MTKVEAIENINAIRKYYLQNFGEDTVIKVPIDGDDMRALDMAIKALEAEPSEDAISRQAAINAASGYCHSANVAKELAKLPPVNPQEPKTGWIPIKEKRPNVPEDYIVTINVGDVNCVVMDYYSVMWGCFEGYGKDVIAWMPLPKPYEPQESEEQA